MTFQLEKPILEYIAIRVQNLEQLVLFYKKLPGFHILSEENNAAYFSSDQHQKAWLMLEDTPFGVLEKTKRLARFSLRVNTKKNYETIKQYCFEQNIVILKEKKELAFESFTILDPEKNQLTFLFDTFSNDYSTVYRLANAHLNMNNTANIQRFFHSYLGLTTEKKQGKYFELNQKQWLGINPNAKDPHISKTVETLGLDFLTISLPNQQALQQLVDHFRQLGIDFFKDKKTTIVTLFDFNQVEWWFVVRDKEENE